MLSFKFKYASKIFHLFDLGKLNKNILCLTLHNLNLLRFILIFKNTLFILYKLYFYTEVSK